VSVTVKLVLQVALFPAASVAVNVIVCIPIPSGVPAAGDWLRVIVPDAVQLSPTVRPPRTLGTAAWQVPSALAPGIAEQITLGAVVSVTVKLVVQVALFPAASVAVTVIVCVPIGMSVPAAGDWLKVIPAVAVQLSLTVTPPRTFGTVAWQFPLALASGIAEQITLGAVVSVTVKLVVQVALFPAASVAVNVIVCIPIPTSAPAAGD